MAMNTLLSGSLKEFGLVEVMQVMEMGNMTGALHLKQENGHAGILYFDQGKVANCVEFDSGALTLGDVLQQLHMATHDQIELAFSQQLQDAVGKRIGERLMLMGVINPKQLQEALRTKALWTARELGLWQEGTYEFTASATVQKMLPYGETPLNIEVMRITIEMIRYADEWEKLRPALPLGIRTFLQMSPAIPRPVTMPARIVNLINVVNRFRRVRRIASALHTPELDVARELAQLVQQKLLMPVFHEVTPHHGGKRIQLPDPAEKLRLENFELFNLLSRMEQAWDRLRSPMEQLPALVEFINWTMEALADTCRTNSTILDPNTLITILMRENLTSIGSYSFAIEHNHIDVEHFTTLCRNVLQGDLKNAERFYTDAAAILLRILNTVFESINSRIANPRERVENQEVWEALFEQFALPH